MARKQKILLNSRFTILSDDDFLFKEVGKEETMPCKKLGEACVSREPELTLIFEEIQRYFNFFWELLFCAIRPAAVISEDPKIRWTTNVR
ncbi:MAG: hypothetical protein U5K54_10700 [Cytophagales bacterium]|nr:hypothetical protein [Cytophagales bacterium]